MKRLDFFLNPHLYHPCLMMLKNIKTETIENSLILQRDYAKL